MIYNNVISNEFKIILDLCGGTGAWSKPYKDVGYDVRNITLPDFDVRLYQPPDNVYGILAAPPCTYFCRMRMCRGRPSDDQFREGLSVVDACLRIILLSNPRWWALENPDGYLKNWLGEPALKFEPWYFGDSWTKRTCLWGKFNHPKKHINSIRPILIGKPGKRDRTTRISGSNTEKRSITPLGFAKAFFEANP